MNLGHRFLAISNTSAKYQTSILVRLRQKKTQPCSEIRSEAEMPLDGMVFVPSVDEIPPRMVREVIAGSVDPNWVLKRRIVLFKSWHREKPDQF